jgi:hypothetical protein
MSRIRGPRPNSRIAPNGTAPTYNHTLIDSSGNVMVVGPRLQRRANVAATGYWLPLLAPLGRVSSFDFQGIDTGSTGANLTLIATNCWQRLHVLPGCGGIWCR